jgi:hypothetical protein
MTNNPEPIVYITIKRVNIKINPKRINYLANRHRTLNQEETFFVLSELNRARKALYQIENYISVLQKIERCSISMFRV